MIDRGKLWDSFHWWRQAYFGLLLAPVALMYIVRVLIWKPGGAAQFPLFEQMSLPLLVGHLAVAATPLASIPLMRAWLRKPLQGSLWTASTQRLQALIFTEHYCSCLLWGIPAMTGYVGIILGAPLWFYVIATGLTYVGLVGEFPLWSRWQRQADELDTLAVVPAMRDPL